MNPSLLVYRIHLGPNMVLCIPHPSDTTSDSAAQHAEAIGPLSTSPFPGLQKGPDIAISRESFVVCTLRNGTPIQLDAGSPSGDFIWCRWGHTVRNGGGEAIGTWRVVNPGEETALEPSEEEVLASWNTPPGSSGGTLIKRG